MMIEIEQENLIDLLRIARFCNRDDRYYTNFSGVSFPWSIQLDSSQTDSRVLASDGFILVWMKIPVEIQPFGKVPDLLKYIRSVESVSDWKPLIMSHPTCDYCSDPEETCEFCKTCILEKKFNFELVSSVQDVFEVEGVAIVDESNLAIKFKNGFAYLMGIVSKY